MFSRRKSEPEDQPKSSPIPPPPPLPARTPSQQKPIGFETVIGPGCTLEGTLSSDSNIRLDGIFSGTLAISGNVLVGEMAKVEADINAKNISIAGIIRGNVTGNKVQLLRTARVWGDINAVALTTEEGAFIDGKISMPQHDPEPSEEDPLLEDVAMGDPVDDLFAEAEEEAAEVAVIGADVLDEDVDDEDVDDEDIDAEVVDEDDDTDD